MQIIQNVLSDEEFNHELINRFFNLNSYFFQCVKFELGELLKDEYAPDRPDYLLFGNLIDRLVSSDSKDKILGTLSQIKGFDKFYEKLHEGVQRLRDSELDCENMKSEIKKLAQTITKIGIQAILIDESKNELENYLNIHNKPITGKTSQTLQNETDVNDFTNLFEEQDKIINESLIDELNFDSIEPPSEETLNAEPDLLLECQSDTSELMGEEKEILLQTNEGTDALDNGGCEPGLSEEGGSIEFELKDGTNNKTLNHEPSSIIESFNDEIRCQIKQIHNAINILNNDFKNRKQWQACDKMFEVIASKAMIFGFDAYEEIAMKAQMFIASVLSDIESYPESVLAILSEAGHVLESMCESDVDDKAIENLSKKLMDPRKAIKDNALTLDNKPATELKNSEKQELPGNAYETANDVAVPKEETPDIIPDDNLNLKSSDFEISNFKLPGEDDDEILNMVAEITNENTDEEIQFINNENKSELSDIQEAADNIEEEPDDESNNVVEEVVSSLSNEQLDHFNDQAEFYYNIIEEALSKLKAEPYDISALEDLELASNSIYGLTLKLNLEPLSKFPASVEELIGKIISTKSSLPENGQKLIKNVYRKFRDFTSIAETETSQYTELLTMIQDLNSSIQKKTNHYPLMDEDLLRLYKK